MKKMKKKKIKLCKNGCGRKKYGNLAICYNCYRKREREKKKEQILRAKLRKHKTKKYQKSQLKILHRQCWKLMSEAVRSTGADWRGYQTCYTCRKPFKWEEMHASHRHHNKLDFDFRNIKPCCNKCNTFLGGNLGEYERHIIEDHGLEYAQRLKNDADKFIGYTHEELLEIKEKLSD